jgi:hypothetical protein
MADFTPGPWEWVEDRFWGGYSGIVGKDDTPVLYPDHSNDGDDGAAWFEEFPTEADRNLIISSPDMYEALKAIIESGEIPLCYSDKLVVAARQALAKAEGR